MNVLADFLMRVEEEFPSQVGNEELNALLLTISNQGTEIEARTRSVTEYSFSKASFWSLLPSHADVSRASSALDMGTAASAPKLKLLLRNSKLSDDIAFRFSDYSWSEYPLTRAISSRVCALRLR